MPRFHLEKLLVWLALVAYGLTAVLPGGGIVLCFEADGHVTIEIASDGCSDCCAEDEAPRDADIRLDSCPCVDVALVGAGVLLAKTKTSEVSGPAPVSSVGEPLRSPPTLLSKLAPLATRPDAHRNSPVELVSCVILRV